MLLRTKLIGGILAASIILVGAGVMMVADEKMDTTTVTCEASTGDIIDITSGYKINSSADTFVLTKNDDVLMEGQLLDEKEYSAYFATVYTDGACSIIDKAEGNGISYIFYSHSTENDISYHYLGWIIGSNTGIILEGNDSKSITNNIFDTIQVAVKSTEEENGYIYVPDNKVEEETNSPEEKTDGTETAENKDSNTEKWTDITIKIDGKEFQYPYSYEDLKELGWSFDTSDYTANESNEYIVNAGERTSQVKLCNEEYGFDDTDAKISVTFINNEKEAADITKCSINSISVSAVYGFDTLSKYPDIELEGGISFGSTENEIRAAYGEPSEVYEGTYYTELTYNSDNSRYMILYIYQDRGLMDVELKGF